MNEQDIDVMGRMFTKEVFARGLDPKWWAWFSSGASGPEPLVPGPLSESFPDGPFSASDAPGLRFVDDAKQGIRRLIMENVFPGKCVACSRKVRVSEGVCTSKNLLADNDCPNGFFFLCRRCSSKTVPVSGTWPRP
jgi:hypothetical protein